MKARLMEASAGANQGIDLESLTAEYDQNKDAVVDMLVKNCLNVDISIPRVVMGNFDEK